MKKLRYIIMPVIVGLTMSACGNNVETPPVSQPEPTLEQRATEIIPTTTPVEPTPTQEVIVEEEVLEPHDMATYMIQLIYNKDIAPIENILPSWPFFPHHST